jgi:hypothetical protein
MRVSISEIEYQKLKMFSDIVPVKELLLKIEVEREKETSSKKKRATKKATKVREDIAKRKIVDAINIKRMYGDKITVYSVAKQAKVSFNTAKKYREIIDVQPTKI